MKRHHMILLGVLAVQIILSVIVFWPRGAAAVESQPFFPNVTAGDIVKLTLTKKDGSRITLRQVTGEWVMADADDYPADATKINPFLEKLLGVTTGRLVTRTDASHKRLQVADNDFDTRVEFETADGKSHILYVGSSPSYGVVHVRLQGQSETYLTDKLSTWEMNTTPTSWVDPTYLKVPQESVTAIKLENVNGVFSFTKKEDGTWAMEGLAADETLDQSKVNTLLQRVILISMNRPLGKTAKPEYGLDAPAATVTIETPGKTYTLRVGAKDASNNYTISSSESAYYVQVAEYIVQSLMESTREGFLQPPSTPTPAPTAAP